MAGDPQEVAEGFLARINHPVIGVFITSAIAWNWEVVYYIFRGLQTPGETIDYVNLHYLNDGNLHNLVVVPLYFTVSFLGGGPWLHRLYDRYKEWTKVIGNKLSPVFKYKLDDLQKEYDAEKLKGQQRENNLADTITFERESTKKKIASLELDLKNYQETFNIQKGGNVQVQGLGIVDIFGLIKSNKDLAGQWESAQRTISDLTKSVQILEKDNTELKVLLEHERKRK